MTPAWSLCGMSRPHISTDNTRNRRACNKALKRRGSLTVWFDPDMAWAAKPTGKRGRQPVCSAAAVQTCLTMKVLSGMALGQTTGVVESLLRRVGLDWGRPGLGSAWTGVGLDWAVPDFSTLGRRRKTLAVNLPHRGSRGPLQLLIDSTGIRAEAESGWSEADQKTVRRTVFPPNAHAWRRQTRSPLSLGPMARHWLTWRKVHRGIDAQRLEIRAVEVTGSDVGDAPRLPELLARIRADQAIASVTADAACDPRTGHDAIADRGATAFGHSLDPVALVPALPPRKNAKPWKTATAGAAACNEALRASKYLGRGLWRRCSGYHRRRGAETRMRLA